MAEDSFNISNMEAALTSMNKIHGASEQAASQMRDMSAAMQNIVETGAQFGTMGEFLSPDSVKEILELVNELRENMTAIGDGHVEHLAHRKAEVNLMKEEVGYWDQILKKSNAVAAGQKGAAKGKGEGAKSDEKSQGIEEKRLSLQEKSVKYVKQQAKAMSGFVQSNAGVQLSFIGILALILDIYNESRRMTAMQKKYAAQWDYVPKKMKVASGLMSEIRRSFGKTYEEIGPYLNSLAQAGLNMEQMKKLSVELLAVQELQGQAIGDQVGKIKQLVNNFDRTGEEAQSYLSTIRLAATAMREEGGIVISMQEAVDLTTELADKTKVYNTDLLGTLALFNALARKDVAERLGLGDAPLKVRKEIAKTISGFSAELEDGWKAALGEGASAAARILNFEKLLPPQQFQRMAEFITEKTRGFQGETRELAIRQLLKQFGFTSKEVQTVMARAFQTGGLSGEGLRGVMKEISKQREAMANLEKKAAEQRSELIKAGQSVSKGLISVQDQVARAIRDALREPVRQIVNAISRLIAALPSAKDVKEIGGGLGEVGGLERENLKRAVRRQQAARGAAAFRGGGFPGEIAMMGEVLPKGLEAVIAGQAKKYVMKRGEMLEKEYGAGVGAYRAAAAEVTSGLMGFPAFAKALEQWKSNAKQDAINTLQNLMKREDVRERLMAETPTTANFEELTFR